MNENKLIAKIDFNENIVKRQLKQHFNYIWKNKIRSIVKSLFAFIAFYFIIGVVFYKGVQLNSSLISCLFFRDYTLEFLF